MNALLLMITFIFASPSPPQTVRLSIGETYKISTPPLQTLRIQRKGILSIKDEGSQVIVTGKKLGSTEIEIGTNKWLFQVLHKHDHHSFTQLKGWLEGKRGPSLDLEGGFTTLGGRILRIDDFISLRQWTDENSKFKIQCEADSSLQTEILQFVNSLVQKNNLPPGELTFSPHWTYRVGKPHKDSLGLYKKILKPFGIEVRWDQSHITSTPMIEISVFITHVKKSWMRQWGLSWPSQAQLSVVPGGESQWTRLAISLQALEESGEGRVLANPTLVTEAGQQAEFHSGGEFPIRTTTQFSNDVQWKRYGLSLKTTPTTNSQGHLHFAIDLEMSSLDQTQMAEGVPAIQRSEIKTQLHMKKPQPFFLSGFLQQGQGSIKSGLPWLQQVPLFDPLFSNKMIYNTDYELIFILIPKYYD